MNSDTFRARGCPIPTLLSPGDCTLERGQQVYLRYGAHSISTLFVEYGFVGDQESIDYSIAVDEEIKGLFSTDLGGEAKVQLLMENNYWE